MEEVSQTAKEATSYKDQLDEMRQAAEKLQKSEAIIEKYKKRLEEAGDSKRQTKVNHLSCV